MILRVTLVCLLACLTSCKTEKSTEDILLSASYKESSRVYYDRSEHLDRIMAERATSGTAIEKRKIVTNIRSVVAETLSSLQGTNREHSLEKVAAGRNAVDSLSEFETGFTDISLLENLDDKMFQEAILNDFRRVEMKILEMYHSKYFMAIP